MVNRIESIASIDPITVISVWADRLFRKKKITKYF